MSKKTETKEQSGGPGGLIFLTLLVLFVWAPWKKKPATAAVDPSAVDYGYGGGGGGGYDGGYSDGAAVIVYHNDDANNVPGNAPSYGGGASSGSVTPIKQAMTARTLDPEWQAQKARINMAVIPEYQRKQIEKGAVTANTLKSIADYQQVKAGTMSAFDYANDPNMPEEMRAGIESAQYYFQQSPTEVLNRALALYSSQTGAHRGAMTAAQRTAWDTANKKAALEAYAAAAGSGWQADTARKLAAQLPGAISIVQAGTMKTTQPVTAAQKAAEAARTSTASKGSAQPGIGSKSGTVPAKSSSKALAGVGLGGSIAKK